jgi:hypothetical protein
MEVCAMTDTTRHAMLIGLLIGVAALFSCPGRLTGQERDTLLARLVLPTMPMEQAEAPPAPPPIRSILVFPGITIISPAALGAEAGTIYVGAGYQARTRYLSDEDGAVFAGFGVGDAHEYAALEVGVTSFSTVRSGFFERMGFGAQLHRYMNDNTAVAVGVENLLMINGDESDTDRSFYGVLTRLFPLSDDPTEPFSLVTATIGVGDGRFRRESDVLNERSTVGVFGSVSLHVIRPLAVIADWTGQDLALGLSLAPFTRFPLVITPAVVDVTGAAGDGARFVVAVGIGHRLSRGPVQF